MASASFHFEKHFYITQSVVLGKDRRFTIHGMKHKIAFDNACPCLTVFKCIILKWLQITVFSNRLSPQTHFFNHLNA